MPQTSNTWPSAATETGTGGHGERQPGQQLCDLPQAGAGIKNEGGRRFAVASHGRARCMSAISDEVWAGGTRGSADSAQAQARLLSLGSQR